MGLNSPKLCLTSRYLYTIGHCNTFSHPPVVKMYRKRCSTLTLLKRSTVSGEVSKQMGGKSGGKYEAESLPSTLYEKQVPIFSQSSQLCSFSQCKTGNLNKPFQGRGGKGSITLLSPVSPPTQSLYFCLRRRRSCSFLCLV